MKENNTHFKVNNFLHLAPYKNVAQYLQQTKAPGFSQPPHKTGVFEPVAVTTTSASLTATSALSYGIAPVFLANSSALLAVRFQTLT